MANGALASAAGIDLPDLTKNPAGVDLSGMAGSMKKATTYKPNDDAMVSGQLGKLLSKDSDYMARARTSAMQTANSRGLMNSSIAGTAGEAAAIDAAMPIARDDAGAHFRAQQENAGAENAFGRDENAFGRQGALDRYRGALSMASQGRELESAGQDRELRRDTANADNLYRNADLSFRTNTQTSDSAYRNADLDFRRSANAGELGLRGQDLALRRDAQTADNAYRDSDLSFRRDTAGADLGLRRDAQTADNTFRNADLGFRRDAATSDLGLRRDAQTADNQFRNADLGFRKDAAGADLSFRRDSAGADLALRRDTANADNTFRNADLGFRRDATSADNALRSADLGLRRDTATADNQFRTSDLNFRKDAAGADNALKASDLEFRKSASASDTALRNRDLGLKDRDLSQTAQFRQDQLAQTASENSLNRGADTSRLDRQARSQLSGDIRQLRQQASQSQAALEADPNMSSDAKRTAITNLAAKAKADILEVVKFSGLSMPDAWPDSVHEIGVAAPAEARPAQASAAPDVFRPRNDNYSQPDRDWGS